MPGLLALSVRYIQQLFTAAFHLGSNVAAHLFRLFPSLTTDKASNQVTLKGAASCRYRLDTDSSDSFTLPDGRQLGYAQYGSLTGKPILYLHGLPGSRIEAASYEELALELGARIIATDRPGIGWSTPQPDRTLLDFPKDLELLVGHLELEEYAVLGVSGGGPYALACASSLPHDRLKCVSIVCGLGPPNIGMKGANWLNWLGFTVGWRYAPLIIIRWFLQSTPFGWLDLTDDERLQLVMSPSKLQAITNERDLAVMKDEDILRLTMRSTRQSFAQGYEGIRQDGKVMCMDFGFRIEDIRSDLPVQLWYGKHDTYVPLNHGEQIAARLGGRAHFRVEDDTHASISMRWKREVLEALIKEF